MLHKQSRVLMLPQQGGSLPVCLRILLVHTHASCWGASVEIAATLQVSVFVRVLTLRTAISVFPQLLTSVP